MKPLITTLCVACAQETKEITHTTPPKGGEPESKRVLSFWEAQDGAFFDLKGLSFDTQSPASIGAASGALCECLVVVRGGDRSSSIELSSCAPSTIQREERDASVS